MLDVTALVQQMRDTLSEIHDTITSLDTKGHDKRLDELESHRDEIFRQLHSAFEKETAELGQRRQAERDQIAEKRRQEDEEIAARRRREDEEKATRDLDHDAGREQKLESEKDGVEEETDVKMDHIEEEARRMLDEGHSKLRDLEERRREINRMIDEQMKAPLPPPPARRARRGTRVSQSGPAEGSRPQESRTPPEAQSLGQAPEAEAHAARSIEPEESIQRGISQAEPKRIEAQQEPSSTEQVSAGEESPSRDQPQEQSAGSVSLHEKPADDDQSERQESVSAAQPSSAADTSPDEPVAQDHASIANQVTGEDQETPRQAAEQPAVSSEQNEQSKEATTDSAHGELGDSSREISAETEPVSETVEAKGRELDSGNTQEYSQGSDGDASLSTPLQSQNQALEAGEAGAHSSFENAHHSTEPQAKAPNQEGLETPKNPASPKDLTGTEVHPLDKSAHKAESDQIETQPTINDSKTLEQSDERERPTSPKNDDLFLGVAKGGAAEEYVKMAEAEFDQEPQLGRDISPTPEQHTLSGSGHPREKLHEDSGHGVEEPGQTHSGSSTIDQGSPGHAGQAHAGEETPSPPGPADFEEDKARPPVESEHEIDQVQNRDIDSHDLDAEESRAPPADGSNDERSESPEHDSQDSREQAASGESQKLGGAPVEESKHDTHSAVPQDSPSPRDVESPNSEQVQPELGEQSRSQYTPTEPVSQQRDFEMPESHKADVNQLPDSGKDADNSQSPEAQQEPQGNEQSDHILGAKHGGQENSDIDTASKVEPSAASRQDPSISEHSDSGTLRHDTQLDKDPGDTEGTAGFPGHEQIRESHDQPQTSIDQASEESGGQVTQQSLHDPPNIVEPGDIDTPHGSAHEQDVGDKRSDSGYETGMASSRNLEDSTTTLHEDEHEDKSVQSSEHPLADASSQSEQEKPRESRPEQILEGSGKDVSPPRPGGDQQGSGDHPVEETFDLSGSEPIPGTMTHGKDGSEDKEEEHSGGEVSLPDASHQQPADDPMSGAITSDQDRDKDVDETHERQNMESALSHGSQQGADQDQTRTRSPSTAHDEGIVPNDSRSQGAGEQFQLEDSQRVPQTLSSGVVESQNQAMFGETKDDSEQSTANDAHAEQRHSMNDIEKATDRGMNEPQRDTSREGNSDSVPASMPEPSQLSQSPTHDISSDGFGSWSSRAFSRPPDDDEFSFKKRADSVQVGTSHIPAGRGAELPSISTDGPHEDPDEGLFAVPPTPRHEVDQDKPSQLQGNGESKATSRASSRNGSTGADTLSPQAAEGIQGSHHEGSGQELPLEASAANEDTQHEASTSSDEGLQARPDIVEMPCSPVEMAARTDGLAESSSRGDLDRGQPEEPPYTGAESMHYESSAGVGDEQQAQQHTFDSPPSPEEAPAVSERHLDEPLQSETPSLGKETSYGPSKADTNEDHNGGTQAGSGDESRDISSQRDSEPFGLQKGHDLEQEDLDSGKPDGQTADSAEGASEREGAQEDFSSREMHTQPDLEPVERESGESGNGELDENGQVPEPRDIEDPTFRSVSPGDEEPANGRDSSEQIASAPQLGHGGTQQPETSHEPEGARLDHNGADVGRAANHQPSPYQSNQHLDARQVNYDGEGYGVTPSSEYSNDPYADSVPPENNNVHSADDPINTRQSEAQTHDLPDSARVSQSDDPWDSDTEVFETPFESAGFREDHKDGQAVTSGHFTQALGHLPDESAHTVQGTDDLFDDTDDTEDQEDYGEAVVYQQPNEANDSSADAEKTVYSTRGDENNTALGGHRSSLSLGSVGHRSQGSISSLRDTTPVRPTFGSYIGGPSIVRADWAAEHEDELRPPSLNPTPQLGPSTSHDTPEISPFALRNTPMPGSAADPRGLSSSRWNPERPQTPPSSTTRSNNPFATPQRQSEPEADLSLFVPRDVTHGRQDSIPASLHSQTTLDSSWSSPVHSSLPVDRHEPVIRDSWPAPAPGYQQYLSGWSSRPRGDTTSTSAEYDPFRPDNGGQTAAKSSSSYNPFLQRGRAESSVSAVPSDPSVSSSPSRGSALFAKMRNIFENQGSDGGSNAPASPGKTRPVSGVFHPAVSAQRSSQDLVAGQRHDEHGGFLNEADHEIDERSAFLRSDGQPSGHATYHDEH
ncbi:hypothetical protein Daus18300_014342 [Diaporthe australafricana]|uniref:Involucrin repeat protein n=1 Tax=Diaporthe australafricana TaxID=127596 RepID=A0ABR3VVN9_9PEZI